MMSSSTSREKIASPQAPGAVEVGDAELALDIRVARPAVAASVERQEPRPAVRKPRRHRHVVLVEREMHERAALEGQQRLACRRAVVPVLLLGVLERGAGQEVLRLHRRDGQAVDEEHDVEPPAVLLAVLDLLHHAQDVRLVLGDALRLQGARGPEVAERKLDAGDDLDALAQHVEQPAILQRLRKLREEGLLG